jgi:VanZ family protein
VIKTFCRYWLPVVVWAGVIFYMSSYANPVFSPLGQTARRELKQVDIPGVSVQALVGGIHPNKLAVDLAKSEVNRRLVHFGLYVVLGIVVVRAFAQDFFNHRGHREHGEVEKREEQDLFHRGERRGRGEEEGEDLFNHRGHREHREVEGERKKLEISRGWMLNLISLGGCAAYGLSDEFHQLFVPGRDFQLGDLLVDTLGALVGIVLYRAVIWLWARRRQKRGEIETG